MLANAKCQYWYAMLNCMWIISPYIFSGFSLCLSAFVSCVSVNFIKFYFVLNFWHLRCPFLSWNGIMLGLSVSIQLAHFPWIMDSIGSSLYGILHVWYIYIFFSGSFGRGRWWYTRLFDGARGDWIRWKTCPRAASAVTWSQSKTGNRSYILISPIRKTNASFCTCCGWFS